MLKTLMLSDTELSAFQGEVLVVICAYRGDDTQPDQAGLLWRIFRRTPLYRWRIHCRQQMNYYANPRDVGYAMETLKRFWESNNIRSQPRIIVDDGFFEANQPLSSPVGPVASAMPVHAIEANRDVKTILLIFSDAIGLGCEPIEAAASKAPNVFVATGRRRLFRLTPEMRRILASRRFHSRWRLAELLLAVAFVPLSAIMALIDWMTVKGRKST